MTKILIIGAEGMIGKKLCHAIMHNNHFGVTELFLHDIVIGDKPTSPSIKVSQSQGDFGHPAEIAKIMAFKADIIFNCAAVVSGEAERDFQKGLTINFDNNYRLLESIRACKDYHPKIIFTSSIAVYGAPFPSVIEDDFFLTPKTSYGTQKAMVEFLLNDYTRKGYISALSIRLPTICVRPGKPNAAASGFFSGIIREPLHGIEAILPVPGTVRHWHASPTSAINFLIKSAQCDLSLLDGRYALNMPGVSCTVAEQIEALQRFAGNDIIKLIKKVPNPEIMDIVKNWAQNFNPARARSLGFVAESNFDEIIAEYAKNNL